MDKEVFYGFYYCCFLISSFFSEEKKQAQGSGGEGVNLLLVMHLIYAFIDICIGIIVYLHDLIYHSHCNNNIKLPFQLFC